MLIARLIADPDTLGDRLGEAMAAIEDLGCEVCGAGMLDSNPDVLEVEIADADDPTRFSGDLGAVRAVFDRWFDDADLLLARGPVVMPSVFVSDMDSTMIGQECIDELADFAGIKPQVAAITARAMAGELDFAAALAERVALLRDLPVAEIERCLDERIRPMDGARQLVATLKAHGVHCVLVTGGFHDFADVVGAALGFDYVLANRLGAADGRLTGTVEGAIVDATAKARALGDALAAHGAVALATGDGANDIPMLTAAEYGFAFRAKPKARAAAGGRIDRGDLTAVLDLLGIARDRWAEGTS